MSAIGGVAGQVFGQTRAGRAIGVNRYEGQRLGQQLGLAMAGPLTRGLDECDQQWVSSTSETTLNTGEQTSWSGQETGSGSNSSGTNRIVPTDPAILRAHPGQVCRTVEQQISSSDGSGIQTVTACKGDDGIWQPVT
jgi:hypothetical protein